MSDPKEWTGQKIKTLLKGVDSSYQLSVTKVRGVLYIPCFSITFKGYHGEYGNEEYHRELARLSSLVHKILVPLNPSSLSEEEQRWNSLTDGTASNLYSHKFDYSIYLDC